MSASASGRFPLTLQLTKMDAGDDVNEHGWEEQVSLTCGTSVAARLLDYSACCRLVRVRLFRFKVSFEDFFFNCFLSLTQSGSFIDHTVLY